MRATPLIVIYCACFSMPPRPGASNVDASNTFVPDASGSATGSANIAFVTSTTVTGAIGRSGADALCSTLAGSAQLPGTFVAWLSTSSASAVDRLGTAQGWVRPDHQPFANQISDLTAGKILFPLVLDERGSAHYGESEFVLTGTLADGELGSAASNCNDFSDGGSDAHAWYGLPPTSTVNWTYTFNGPCTDPAHLYCFGTDYEASVSLPTPGVGARYAFVTDPGFTPGGGLGSADGYCDSQKQGLPGLYVALLATSTESAASRASGTFVRPDGVVLGALDDQLVATINVTADGRYLTGSVWTGAANPTTPLTSPGTVASTCDNWTASAQPSTATFGAASVASSPFFFAASSECSAQLSLYCVRSD